MSAFCLLKQINENQKELHTSRWPKDQFLFYLFICPKKTGGRERFIFLKVRIIDPFLSAL